MFWKGCGVGCGGAEKEDEVGKGKSVHSWECGVGVCVGYTKVLVIEWDDRCQG